MPLPDELSKIKARLETRRSTLSEGEKALLSELVEIDRRITTTQLNEVRSNVTKMTGPAGGCPCCGR